MTAAIMVLIWGAARMALSKNWVQDFERWSVEDNPMALLGDVASVPWSLSLNCCPCAYVVACV